MEKKFVLSVMSSTSTLSAKNMYLTDVAPQSSTQATEEDCTTTCLKSSHTGATRTAESSFHAKLHGETYLLSICSRSSRMFADTNKITAVLCGQQFQS